ncbi:MAG: septum formation protein Maf [Acetobacteraceae bacterium]|nr:septum formation protein Maf [Acetobacteraceae bacterium]
MQRPEPRLVLASGSPTRKALLSAAGLQFEAIPARVDEAAIKAEARQQGCTGGETAARLADRKAEEVARSATDALVIGADQLLVCQGEWFDKPASIEDARLQLLRLRGQTHVLHTAITCQYAGQRVWTYKASPSLTMRAFSNRFLDDYLALEGDRVLTSVGAYRLEAAGIHLFERVEGEHSAILGLPLLALLEFLRHWGVLQP